MTNTKLVADILQNISVQNVNKALVYITDWTSPLNSPYDDEILYIWNYRLIKVMTKNLRDCSYKSSL